MQIDLQGVLIGLITFFVIGLFHPIVIKTEYYFGTRPWWVFLALGIAGVVGALFVKCVFWSAVLSVVAFSCFWSIKELFDQRERVRKGWFPRNPRRREQS